MSNVLKLEISEEDWNELVKAWYSVQALEIAGVDNWDGVDEANDIFQDLMEEDADNLLKYSTINNVTIH